MRKLQNIYSHLTAKERTKLSVPAHFLLEKNLLQGKILDFGCGFGKDVELLRGANFEVVGYDPFYFPSMPIDSFDTILCIYVLNVLQPEQQSEVLMNISKLLKPLGKAFFAVRRDVTFEGFRTHKIHQKPTYQCVVKLPYRSIFQNESYEIYQYQHYNQIEPMPNTLDCPFCRLEKERELIVESALAFSIFDKFPVSDGHALVIPKRHVSNYFDLSFKEQSACWLMVNKVKQILNERFKVEDFNIGINVGTIAGQTVSHVHIHIIPRYKGDVENPIGGVRNVIVGKGAY
jgi:diadenosine tetraphosphate (Ap4A) HIT family hydrolase